MMNLLLVDDQTSVLEGLLHGIDFDALGYTRVFTASNAADAIRICEENTIMVLVTDIEMPGQSGIELNEYLQKRFPSIIRIVMTSHSKISYAQSSLRLGCFDFIVQPSPYEVIAQTLKRAVEAWNLNFNNRRLMEYGALFKSNPNEFLAKAIENLYVGTTDEIEESMQLLNKAGYSFAMDSLVHLFWVDVHAYTRKEPNYPSQRFLMKTINDSVPVLFQGESLSYFIVMTPFRMFSIFIIDNNGQLPPVQEEDLWNFYLSLEKKLKTKNITLYFSNPVTYKNILNEIRFANNCIGNNVSGKSGIFNTSASEAADSSVSTDTTINQKHWNSLLRTGQHSMLKKEIQLYLDRNVLDKPNSLQLLKKAHQQIINLFLIYFYENNVEVGSIFSEDFTYQDCMDSFSTIDAVIKTVDYLIKALKQCQKTDDSEEDYVSRAKSYVIDHYNSELSIKEIADFIHLSPEYLTRLFKKETGSTLKDYIIECRISTAKDLLANSSLSISMIASEVGYHNFSYFAYLFKKLEQVTPREYRNKFAAQPIPE
ncbi:MAG: response regulator transcription factor [Acutalibacter sp.]